MERRPISSMCASPMSKFKGMPFQNSNSLPLLLTVVVVVVVVVVVMAVVAMAGWCIRHR